MNDFQVIDKSQLVEDIREALQALRGKISEQHNDIGELIEGVDAIIKKHRIIFAVYLRIPTTPIRNIKTLAGILEECAQYIAASDNERDLLSELSTVLKTKGKELFSVG